MKNAAGQTTAEWKRGLTASIMAFGLALGAGAAPAYQAQITASGYAGESTLADFPVLVRISPSTISGFAYAQCADAGGADLSFVLADGTVLSHEIDTWNIEGESTVWVKIPSLAKDTAFMMWWGDSDVTTSTSTNAAWNSNYVGVWHLGEASGTCANSTSKSTKYDAEPVGDTANSTLYSGADAPVGGARTTATTTGGSGYLVVPSYKDENVTDTFTISGWVRSDGANSGWPRPFARRDKWETGTGGFMVGFSTMRKFTTCGADGNGKFDTTIPGNGCESTWTHLALVYEGKKAYAYVNGSLGNSGAVTPVTENDLPLYIGSNSGNASAQYFKGAFDECRLMKGAASADWVKAEYDTVKSASFLTYDAVVEVSDDLNVTKSVSTSTTTATIRATVLAVGTGASTVSVSVRYGTSADNLSTTVELGSASAAGVLSTTLTGLLPEATYYAQIVATNDKEETFEGQVFSFATPTNVSLASEDLDGTGGDTLTLSGSVSDFSGTCTLKVLTGASADKLDNEWTTSDLGAGATLSAPGDFALSLCEKDTSSSRYLTPGSTVYVRVEATADGRTTRSAIRKVVMSGDPVLKSSSTSQTRKKVTFTAQFSDLGMGGKVTLALWYRVKGTGEYVKVEETEREVTSTDSFSFVFDFPDYSTTYDYELRVTSASAGGTVAKTASVKTANVTTKATPPVHRVVPDEASKSVSGWENASTDLKGTIEGVKDVEEIVEVMNGRYVITNQISLSNASAAGLVIRSVNPETGATDMGGATFDAEGKCRIMWNSRAGIFRGITFANGHADGDAGAVGGNVTAYDCVFTNNYASEDGGAVAGGIGIFTGAFSNCVFACNWADGGKGATAHGGGAVEVFNGDGQVTFTDCVFSGNCVTNNANGSAVQITNTDWDAPVVFSGCTFVGNYGAKPGQELNTYVLGIGGRGSFADRLMVVTNCTFVANRGPAIAPNARTFYDGKAYPAGTWVMDCVFAGNEGNCVVSGCDTNSAFVGCVFTNNVAKMFKSSAGNLGKYRNCLIADNTFADGVFYKWTGAASDRGLMTPLDSCTFAGNACTNGTFFAICRQSMTGLALTNTVFYGNTFKNSSLSSLKGTENSFCRVCTDDADILAVVGETDVVISNDPLFADAAAGDYRLKRKSPCREAGVWLDWMTGAVDLAGNPRVLDRDGRVSASALPDLGCYECTEKTPGFLLIVR